MKKQQQICICCKKIIEDELYDTEDGKVCEECFFNYYYECQDCGRVIYDEYTRIVNDEYSDYSVCEDCFQKNYRVCDKCGFAYRKDIIECDEYECICIYCK